MLNPVPDFNVSMSAPDERESTCSCNDESIADYSLTTFVGHNACPSRTVDKSRIVAAIDAELRDEDGDPIPPKQQCAPQARKAVPKCKRNDTGEESDPNDDDFASSGEGSEDSTSDDESVIISNIEVCSNSQISTPIFDLSN